MIKQATYRVSFLAALLLAVFCTVQFAQVSFLEEENEVEESAYYQSSYFEKLRSNLPFIKHKRVRFVPSSSNNVFIQQSKIAHQAVVVVKKYKQYCSFKLCDRCTVLA